MGQTNNWKGTFSFNMRHTSGSSGRQPLEKIWCTKGLGRVDLRGHGHEQHKGFEWPCHVRSVWQRTCVNHICSNGCLLL